MRLFWQACRLQIKSDMQYPASFCMLMVTSIFIPVSSMVSIYFLFDRFKTLNGYTMYEVLFFFAVIYFGFSVSEMMFRGLDQFPSQIRRGNFDRMLVRPRPPVLQILCSRFEFNRVGRVVVSVALLLYTFTHLTIQWSPGKLALTLLMLAAAVAVYFGIMLIYAGLCFFTVEGLEVVNILINGGEQTVRYPIAIYDKAFRVFFTFIVPMAAANYYPAMYLLGRAGDAGVLYALTPLLSFVFLLPCVLFWRWSLGKYTSAGG